MSKLQEILSKIFSLVITCNNRAKWAKSHKTDKTVAAQHAQWQALETKDKSLCGPKIKFGVEAPSDKK